MLPGSAVVAPLTICAVFRSRGLVLYVAGNGAGCYPSSDSFPLRKSRPRRQLPKGGRPGGPPSRPMIPRKRLTKAGIAAEVVTSNLFQSHVPHDGWVSARAGVFQGHLSLAAERGWARRNVTSFTRSFTRRWNPPAPGSLTLKRSELRKDLDNEISTRTHKAS